MDKESRVTGPEAGEDMIILIEDGEGGRAAPLGPGQVRPGGGEVPGEGTPLPGTAGGYAPGGMAGAGGDAVAGAVAPAPRAGDGGDQGAWKVLVVDDDRDVHLVTNMVLRDFEYEGRRLELLDAYSAAGAVEVLRANPDVALILLDVIMETQDAGLRVVKTLREDLGLRDTRIVLRTGQPGVAPELSVIRTYDINDYQTKTELTNNRLITVVTAALRAFGYIRTIACMRDGLERMVTERTSELADLVVAKDKMFAIIAHDLRGPVSNVKGFLDLLMDTMEPHSKEEIDEYLRILHLNANATMALLDNLLYWARNERGLLETDLTVCELAPVLREAIDITRGAAATKGIRILLEVDKGVQCLMDRQMIALVVRNLVSNSIKFTPLGGRVSVWAGLDPGTDQAGTEQGAAGAGRAGAEQGGKGPAGGRRVRVRVSDTGVGMSPTQIERLFKVKTHRSTYGTNNERGSGLGLLLCNDFAERHGGVLEVSSTLGKGSMFSFTLPLVDEGSA